ncbi:MAG TPA: permease [candidate division WOR-3 bacterium]|uniref:Permease n=1 Tax=candidate division WOR-3 bacterium TaxID=2052148 RepID=A0A7V5LTI0_UNCW3|nr:permease [candidate division WOR-3 bacterium]
MLNLLVGGVEALFDYIAKHTITCLIPAFLLAGGMVTFINREAVLQHLGESVNKLKSFSLASIASFLIAACSCTVIPVSSGLYFAGAGVGVAFIILWVAPAANILALTYTGSILGSKMVISRVIAAIFMAFVVGEIMTLFFKKDRPIETPVAQVEKSEGIIKGKHLVLLILILISLLLPNYLVQKGPYIYKVVVWGIFTVIAFLYAFLKMPREEIKGWLLESWWFVKIIFPLLLLGVFIVGIIGKLIPETWIHQWLGNNSIKSSFLATLIGAFSYFATMTEAPFVDTLMKMGMAKGPALALLLTGPGISLPNWLAIARVFGIKKALVYVPTIIILGTIVGWFFGNFIF